ncbi:sigma-70 family RNA polymerase sigma factor [bacterium]|nr:MAG: sigma-70 family RNA polymerase sigma factor [bacterium]
MSLYSLEGKVRMERGWDENGWVRAAQAGDLSAFDELVRRYRPAATLTARGVLPSRELADDAVQDAFVAAYKALPQLADPNRFGSWVGSIVRHRAFRIRAGERTPPLPIDDFILSYVPSIQKELEEEEDRAEVRCALGQLAEELRTVVGLYYLSDWSVGDIADYTGLPRTTVKWRLHTGRQRLRALLSDVNGEPL